MVSGFGVIDQGDVVLFKVFGVVVRGGGGDRWWCMWRYCGVCDHVKKAYIPMTAV